MTPEQISSILWDCLPAEEKQVIAIEATRRMMSAQLYGSPDTSCCDCGSSDSEVLWLPYPSSYFPRTLVPAY